MKKRIITLFLLILFGTTANAEWIEQSMSSGYEEVNTYVENTNENQQHNNNYTNNANEGKNIQSKKEVTYITTPNSTNSRLKFMYYIPGNLVNSSENFPVIVFVPGLDGDGESELPQEFYELADKHGFGILTPTFKFNQADFDKKQSYQYPQAWAGNALVSMLNRAKLSGLNYSKVYLVGFSAGAQFASRFSFMRPDLVSACAILGSGARVKPETKTNVKYFVGIGSMDTDYRKENAQIFTSAARSLGIPVVYRQYAIDHGVSEDEIRDVGNFFVNVKNGGI